MKSIIAFCAFVILSTSAFAVPIHTFIAGDRYEVLVETSGGSFTFHVEIGGDHAYGVYEFESGCVSEINNVVFYHLKQNHEKASSDHGILIHYASGPVRTNNPCAENRLEFDKFAAESVDELRLLVQSQDREKIQTKLGNKIAQKLPFIITGFTWTKL